VTICNQFPIRKLDTWRHRAREHSTLPIGAPLSPSHYLQPFPRHWAVSILGSRPWPFRVTWRHRLRDNLIPR